mgnify:CR=1 FL=1
MKNTAILSYKEKNMVKEIVGLTSEEVKRSGEIHGKNILEKEKTKEL